MKSQYSDIGFQFNICMSTRINHNRSPSAPIALLFATDHIAIRSFRQTCQKHILQIPLIVIEEHHSLLAATETNLIASIVPPVHQRLVANLIAEPNHRHDFRPSVFAHPPRSAGSVSVEGGRRDVAIRTSWWTCIAPNRSYKLPTMVTYFLGPIYLAPCPQTQTSS